MALSNKRRSQKHGGFYVTGSLVPSEMNITGTLPPLCWFQNIGHHIVLQEFDGKQTKLLFSVFTKVPMPNT